MARKMTEWPSKRGPITKIMPSDGCIGDTVPLAVGKWYEFHEFGWHMGNVGLSYPSKFTSDAEFISSFIEEVGKNMETKSAIALGSSRPTGNWIHVFKDYA